MVAASPYSRARSRKPGGGPGSSIQVRYRPTAAMALMYRDNGRWMNRIHTSFSTSSRRESSTRYGPDPPVLLVQDGVVDPSRARGLQQRDG